MGILLDVNYLIKVASLRQLPHAQEKLKNPIAISHASLPTCKAIWKFAFLNKCRH